MKSLIWIAAAAVAGTAHATTLTLTLTADDYADAYISTDPSVEGTRFFNKTTTWGTNLTESVALTPGVTNYLHVRARDFFGAPSMMIGVASLSDALFEFANGGQQLVTNPNDWKVSVTGWTGTFQTPVDLGGNGSGPWGTRPSIPSSARYLWAQQGGGGPENYYRVEITPVPEPATLAALGLGLAAVARRRRAR